MKKTLIFVFVISYYFLEPLAIYADHDCIDSREYGQKIISVKGLPSNWFKMGDKQITDNSLHDLLKTTYRVNYTSGKDGEGFTFNHFCGYHDGVYITISNDDSGRTVEFSKVAPKCESCKPVNGKSSYLTSGIGLRMGLNKKAVSSILGYPVKSDITTIVFEEIEKEVPHNFFHTQSVRIEFSADKLIRFSIDDYREITN
jgi:hypothetical protein